MHNTVKPRSFAVEDNASLWLPEDLVSIDLGGICLLDTNEQKKVLDAFIEQAGFEIKILYQNRLFALRLDSNGLYLQTVDNQPLRRLTSTVFYTCEFKTHRKIRDLFETVLITSQNKQDLKNIGHDGQTRTIMSRWLHAMNQLPPKQSRKEDGYSKPTVDQSVVNTQQRIIAGARQEIANALFSIVNGHYQQPQSTVTCELRAGNSGCRLSIRATTKSYNVHPNLINVYKTVDAAAKSLVRTSAITGAHVKEYYNAVPGYVVQRLTFAASSNAMLRAHQNDPARELSLLANDLYDVVGACCMAWTVKSFTTTPSSLVRDVYGRAYEFSLTQTSDAWNAHVCTRSK